MNEIGRGIQKAKISLLLKEAFFGNLLMHLEIIPDTNIPTFATNGKCIKYSPAYAKHLTRNETSGVLAHEVMHCVFKHHLTRGGRDHKLWNDAGDYCINPILIESGLTLPKRVLLDRRFTDMTTVQIYNILAAENPPKENPKDQSGGGGGQGDKGQDKKDQGGEGQSGGNQNSTAASCGEIEDSPTLSQANGQEGGEQESKIWNQRIIQAAINAKMAGKMPAGLDRLITGLLAPKVSWKEILWQFVQEVAQDDYSFLRPNRKYISEGIFLPSLYNETSLDIVVAVDTSGSISQDDLNQAASEISEIQNNLDATIYVVYVDAEFEGAQEFNPGDEVKLEAKGGGGTDFNQPFEWVEKKQIDIACMIYLTDGYCSRFPKVEPEYPVLWITNRKRWSVPFGEIVEF
jgi:predicted metal-dependent peptidase